MARMVDDMRRLLAGEIEPPAAATLVGMRLASFAQGEAVVALDADGRHANPMGTVQGGVEVSPQRDAVATPAGHATPVPPSPQ